jgi:mRNA interferase MazF
VNPYIPCKGDFVWLNFDPQSGHEQKGRRTAIIVSNTLFNEKTGLAFACPTTTRDRDYPFHLRIPPGLPVHGVVMIDQVKSIDYSARKVVFISQAPKDLLDDILAILDAILYD